MPPSPELFQLISISHHQVKVCIIVNRSTHTSVVVDKFVLRNLEDTKGKKHENTAAAGIVSHTHCLIVSVISQFNHEGLLQMKTAWKINEQ